MSKTILVIEDEPTMREILEAELTASGYRIVTAANGAEGIQRLQDIEPDLIICDRAMPVMSGYQLLERIRGAYPQYNALPFIFLTALDDERDRNSVAHLEPAAYLKKPIEFEVLHETIKRTLAAR